MSDHVLVTGADGCVGTALVRLLTREGVRTTALVHARSQAELSQRSQALREAVGAPGLVVHPLELERPLGLEGLGGSALVHAAGLTTFSVEHSRAQAVNVEGTRRVLSASLRSGLERVVLLGSVYASGLAPGPVPETPLERPPGFANAYEESKWDAESVAFAARSEGAPVSLLRLATLVADDGSGAVSFPNAVHHALRLALAGLLPLLPADPSTPLHFVTTDQATRAVLGALQGAPPLVANVGSDPTRSVSIGTLLDVAFEAFATVERFRRRRVARPLLCDLETFELYAEAVDPLADPLVASALRSVRPFAPQLSVHKAVQSCVGHTLAPDVLFGVGTQTLEALCLQLAHHGLPRGARRSTT